MARAGEQFVYGIDEAIKVIEQLNYGNGMTKEIINSTMSKALVPVKSLAKSRLRNIKAVSKGSREGFSKLNYINRSISIRPLAKRGIGMRVKAHGPDIPMGKKLWNIEGAAKLFSAGSYLTPDRKGHGNFKGYGNYIREAGAMAQIRVRALFLGGLKHQTDRVVAKTIRRYGRKYGG